MTSVTVGRSGKAVHRLELAAVASRVPGVRLVSNVLRGRRQRGPTDVITITGLELPRVRHPRRRRRRGGRPGPGTRPAGAAEPAGRGARPGRTGGVLMDANGTRHHLILGADDWSAS